MIKHFFAGLEQTVTTPNSEVISTGQVQHSRTPLYQAPNKQAVQISQLLLGEIFDTYSLEPKLSAVGSEQHWHLVQSQRDDYVGYLYSPEIKAPSYTPNAKVCKLSTALYSAPHMKAPMLWQLPFGAQIEVAQSTADYLYSPPLQGWIHSEHVLLDESPHQDPVALARQFIGQSYLWGGRSGWGCDCSSLVQLCYELSGCHLPRDSVLQQRYAPSFSTDNIAIERAQKGDLIYWPGHVAIVSSATQLIHATCIGMHVVEEPIATVCHRMATQQRRQISAVLRPVLTR
ncbi:MAG: NlpC/P60 family protein [Oceanospirillaceae bacterium]